MTYLTLILTLATGAPSHVTLPAWECHAAAAEMHQAWSVGGYVDRDDGVKVIGAVCVQATIEEIHSVESHGPCEMPDA